MGFPAAYQAVFTDSENTINQPIQTGLENIQNAVSVDLVETITCLDTLTPVDGKKCFNMAIEYVSSSTKIVSSYTRQRFRNLFMPGYAKKSFAMMLFDQSFHYWDTDGFNDRNHEVVLECAKRFCQPKTTLIAAELTKVTKNFNVGIGKPTGSKVAGRHYDLNWKAMIGIYNSHKLTDTRADTYISGCLAELLLSMQYGQPPKSSILSTSTPPLWNSGKVKTKAGLLLPSSQRCTTSTTTFCSDRTVYSQQQRRTNR